MDAPEHNLSAKNFRDLLSYTLGAFGHFGEKSLIFDADDEQRETRVANIAATDDHHLAIIEIPAELAHDRRRAIAVYLTCEDLEEGPFKPDPRLLLFSFAERLDQNPPDFELLIAMDPGAWFNPTLISLYQALAPVIAEIEKRQPLN